MPELARPRTLGASAATVRRLESFSLAALPARHSWKLAGWICLASDGGHVSRVNSATPAPLWPQAAAADVSGSPSPAGAAQAASLAEVARSYQARGSRPLIRWTPLAPDDTAEQLAKAGWGSGGEVLVMTLDLEARGSASGAAAAGSHERRVKLSREAQPGWRSLYASSYAPGEAAERLRLALGAPEEKRYAELRLDGRPAGVGLGVLLDGVLGVFDVFTAPDDRRKGVARALLATLLAWGRSEGAASAFLQVAAENTAAVGLYRDLGFAAAYTYVYAAPT